MKKSWNKDVVPYCLAAVLLGAAFFLLDSVHARWTEHRARALVTERLLQQGSTLANAINNKVTMLYGLRSLVEASAETGRIDREFDRIAAAFRSQSPAVHAVELIAGGKNTDPHRLREPGGSDGVTIGGPVESANGATMIIATLPVRCDAHDAPGRIAIQIDVQELFAEAGFPAWDPDLRLIARDAGGSIVFGEANVLAGFPERHRVPLSDGHWELAAVPASGWAAYAADQVAGFRVAGLIIVFLLFTLFIVSTRSRRVLRHLVERRTNELEALNAELRREVDARRRTETDLIAALDKAEHSDRLKDSFIATMSHEIRTPLHVILGYVDLLQLSGEHVGEDQSMYRQSMKNAGRRLMRSVEELLHISSLRAGTFSMNPEDFDLVDTARELTRQYQSDARERGISLVFRSTLRSAMVYADRYSLEQAMHNLIDNAIKYTEVGEVEILVHGEGNDCTLRVRDTGIGISEDYIRHVFDVFSQEKTGYSRPYDGLGLGLALSRQFVERNHGRIALRSRQGEGTECTITLPTIMPVDHGIAEEMRLDAVPHRSNPSLTLIQHVSQVA